MARTLRFGELRLSVEGIALTRQLWSGDDGDVAARLAGMREALDGLASTDPNEVNTMGVAVNELGAVDGYRLWSSTYDEIENPLLVFEEPVVRELVGPGPWGHVLDACAGTGRHLAWLSANATTVTGLDQSAEMLALAKAKVPSASFVLGGLCDDHDGELPDASFDLIVCTLALTHFESLDEPVGVMARLLRPGGRIVLSDFHPLMTTLDGHAFFPADDGQTPFVRNHSHQVSDYLRAFREHGLIVEDCREPVLGEGDGPLGSGVLAMLVPQAARAAYLGLPFVLAWSLRRSG